MPEAHVNRGNALKDLGHLDAASGLAGSPRFDEAMAAYDKALELDAHFPEAHLGRGWLNLLRGDWAAGFPDYEFREKVGEPTFVPLPQPRWDGGPLADERLVLVTRTGRHTIQFCRCAPLLAARGFDVTILTRKAMAPLLSTLQGVTVATDHDKVAQDLKVRWLPLLSVPGMLGIAPEHRPRTCPSCGGAGASRGLAGAARHGLQDRHQLVVRPFRQAALYPARHSACRISRTGRAARRSAYFTTKGPGRRADRPCRIRK